MNDQDRLEPDHADIAIELCDIHGEYQPGSISECPLCARRNLKRVTAATGLEIQLGKLTNNNHFDRIEMRAALQRAIEHLRTYK